MSLRERGCPEHEQTKIVHSLPSQLPSFPWFPTPVSFVLVPWHWKEGAGIRGMEDEVGIPAQATSLPGSCSHCRAVTPLPPAPFSRGRQVTNPLKAPDSSLTQFSMSDKGRKPRCFHLPCLWWRLPCLSLSPQQENTTLPNPGNDRLQNVHSAHSAIYLDLHICIMVLLLSGKDSDCPDQSIHKGEENFLLAL